MGTYFTFFSILASCGSFESGKGKRAKAWVGWFGQEWKWTVVYLDLLGSGCIQNAQG